MNRLKPFSIPFVGLKNGKHQFEFVVDDTFFKEFEYSPLKKGELIVEVEFNKQENMFVTEFFIKGGVDLLCDRCNEEYRQPVQANEKLIFKIGEEAFDESDEVIVIGKNDHEINLAPYIYEFINLAIPIIHIHPDQEDGKPGCNPEVLEILKKLSVNDEDANPDQKKEIVHDPRWDALKKLRDN